MSIAHYLRVLTIASLPMSAFAAPSADQHVPNSQPTATVDPLVVTAPRTPGPGVPDAVFGEADILAQGAGDASELIDDLMQRALTATPGEAPVILLNGHLMRDPARLSAIPPEALRRVELLGTDSEVKYGSHAGREVINVVLRDRFSGLTSEASGSVATQGGRATLDVRDNFLHIDKGWRWSVDGRYTHQDALLEKQRGVSSVDIGVPHPAALDDIQTLLPDEREAAGGFTLNRSFDNGGEANVSASVVANRSVDALVTDLGSTSASPAFAAGGFRSDGLLTNLNIDLDWPMGKWQWSVAGSLQYQRSRTSTAYAPLGSPSGGVDSVPPSSNAGASVITPGLDVMVSGPLGRLPAGPVQATVKSGFSATRLSQFSTASDANPSGAISRLRYYLYSSADLPIASRHGTLGLLGDLTANLNFGFDELSDFGPLKSLGGGLIWSPVQRLKVTATVSAQDEAPGIEQLGNPIIVRPSVPWFDQVTGQTVDVVRVQGGDPNLKATSRRIVRTTAAYKPSRKIGIAVTYTDTELTDPIVSVASLGPQGESAFPDRFVRGANGQLALVDVRPVNISRISTKDLNSGLDFETPLGAVAPGGAGAASKRAHLSISLHYIRRLENRETIAPGWPLLDFLEGEGSAFLPRDQVTLNAAVLAHGMGLRLNGAWQDAARLRYGSQPSGAGTGVLTYSPLARFNLELFGNLADLPRIGVRSAWAKGARLTISVDNLFDARPHIRDAAGATPLVYLPAFVDPVGRSIKITLRKQF